ncbi:MAG: helix-turn-helix domain-containing protein [Phycicoccus sp.]|nr:helix-turn-helix domain-containing protein [Phycicoccus sp.]
MPDTTSQQTVTAAERERALAAAQAAAGALHRAVEALEAAGAELDEALTTARRLRVSWQQLSEATSLTTKQLQWRTFAAAEAANSNGDGPDAGIRAAKPRTGPRPGRGPGVNVARAAEILDVSRTTVYARIESGELESTRNELGQVRVLGLED